MTHFEYFLTIIVNLKFIIKMIYLCAYSSLNGVNIVIPINSKISF